MTGEGSRQRFGRGRFATSLPYLPGFVLGAFVGSQLGNPDLPWVNEATTLPLVLGTVAIAIPLAIMLTVLGQGAAALAMDFRAYRVTLGVGPRLGTFRLGHLRFVIHALPVSSFIALGPRRAGRLHLRWLVVTLAGPGTTLLAVLALLMMDARSDAVGVVRANLVVVLACLAVLDFLPCARVGASSTGDEIIRCIRRDPLIIRALAMAHDTNALVEALEVDDRDELTRLAESTHPAVAGHARLELGDSRSALDALRQAHEAGDGGVWPCLANHLAYLLARSDSRDDLDEALGLVDSLDIDDCGAEAHTAGLVLLRSGQPDEAHSLFRSVDLDRVTALHRAEVTSHTAEAAFATGDREAGRTALSQALAAQSDHPDLLVALDQISAEEAETLLAEWQQIGGSAEERAAALSTRLGEGVTGAMAVLRHQADERPECAELIAALGPHMGHAGTPRWRAKNAS